MAKAVKGAFSVRSLKRAAPQVAARIKTQAGIGAPVAAAAAAVAIAPGVERWPVKTGTDADVREVNLSSPIVPTTVDELVSAPRPADSPRFGRSTARSPRQSSSRTVTSTWCCSRPRARP